MPANIYFDFLETACKFDIRYAQYCIMIQHKYELARKMLKDTQRILERTLYASSQSKFYCQLLLGVTNIRIFYEEILTFQGNYAS